MPRPVEIVPCPPADRRAALNVLYRRASRRARPGLVAEAAEEAARGELDLSGLWVARRGGGLVGALLAQGLAGRAAAVWPPEVGLVFGRSAVAAGLVRAALAALGRDGYRIAQALLDAAAPPAAADDLARGGLPRVTELLSMTRDTAPMPAPCPDAPALTWAPYGAATADAFRDALQATYRGSLDMPELDGARALDDVLAGHRAGGRFDPGRWQLGRLRDDPAVAAVVLLSEVPERGAWELAYLGLTPAARGRGLGRAALAHALDLARPHTRRLELAVDTRNHPAERLYRTAGFVPFDRRAVHLAALEGSRQ